MGEFIALSSSNTLTLMSFSSLSGVGISFGGTNSASFVVSLCAMLLPGLELIKLSPFLDVFLCPFLWAMFATSYSFTWSLHSPRTALSSTTGCSFGGMVKTPGYPWRCLLSDCGL
eukprot:Gb_38928 [translate_table: standard]